MVRSYTCKVLELMDEGVIDPKWLVEALAGWLSENDMKEFYLGPLSEELGLEEEEETIL